MRYEQYARVEVLLPHDVYASLRRMVGSRKVSPTIRALVEEYVAQEPVRQAIERRRQNRGG